MTDEPEFGPAMASLTEKQRGFVMAMIEFPGITQAQAARRAGYSDVKDGAKVRGHYLAHNPMVQEAIREEAGKRLNASSLLAAGVLMELLGDKKIEPKDRIKVAGMLLDRSGFGAAQTINVNKTVTRKMDVSAAAAKIADFRRRFPEHFARMMGEAAPGLPAPVDAEFSEVKQEETE
jgi:hypothetical protein